MQRICRGSHVIRIYGVVQNLNAVPHWKIGFEEGWNERNRWKTREISRGQTSGTEPCNPVIQW